MSLDDDVLCSGSGCDVLHFEIILKSCKFRIILVYRPPNSDRYANIALAKLLSSLVDPHLLDTTIILGDFNLPCIDWSNSHVKIDGIHDCIFNCMSSLGMSQLVTQPTRIANTGHSNILDLIFSNDPLSIGVINYLPPFSTSDHMTIEFIIHCNNDLTTPPVDAGFDETYLPMFDWSKGDYDKINESLFNIDWHQLFGYNFDMNSLWDNFKTIIWPIIELYVPRKMIPHHKKYLPRFYPKHIRVLLNRKAAIWRKLRSNHSSDLYIKYCNITYQCKHAIHEFDSERERNLINTNNLGAFYKFINKKLNNSSGIAPLHNDAGVLLTSDLDKANLLNSYFESVFIKDDGNRPSFPSRLPSAIPPIEISDIHISPSNLLRVMKNLKTNSAAGPDSLPPIFFHHARFSLIHPLTILFRICIDLHELPNEWKFSIITPKFKSGSPSLPSNYRPIALTCTCCKLLETIIADELTDFLLTHKLITKSQHGFLKRHSTTTNLLESLNSWTVSLSNRKSVTIAYVDFQRAFDSISHSKLLLKLSSY